LNRGVKRALPSPSPLAVHWDLDPGVVYLNHGSFGACPRPVLEAQDRYRARMERELVRFFIRELEGLLDETRAALAPLIGCQTRDLVMVPNATVGVATVLGNLDLRPGDEVVMTSHEYPACRHNLERVAERTGATIVRAPLPFPTSSADTLAEAVLAALSPRTRLLLISHTTSPTATTLPVERIVAACNERGIETLVDGAHGIGYADVNLSAINPTYYTSNCHKWLCSPKASAFLYVRTDRHPSIRPLVLSNHAHTGRRDRSRFHIEFDYIGTRDPSAWLAVPDAIDFLAGLVEGGWPAIMRRNRELARDARELVCERLATEPPVPDELCGAMGLVQLSPHDPGLEARLQARPSTHHDALQDALMERHRIEIPVWRDEASGLRFVRLSAQLYNSMEQYDYLADALLQELARERETG